MRVSLALHPGFVGLHRPIEREEIRIPAIGLGVDPVALTIALAARLFAFRLRFGQKNGDVAIGLRSDFLRALEALRAEFLCLPLTLGFHAFIDRLAVLLGQIGPTDAHIDDGDSECLRLVVELIAHTRHQLLTLIAHDLRQCRLAEHPPQRRIEQGGKP